MPDGEVSVLKLSGGGLNLTQSPSTTFNEWVLVVPPGILNRGWLAINAALATSIPRLD